MFVPQNLYLLLTLSDVFSELVISLFPHVSNTSEQYVSSIAKSSPHI